MDTTYATFASESYKNVYINDRVRWLHLISDSVQRESMVRYSFRTSQSTFNCSIEKNAHSS